MLTQVPDAKGRTDPSLMCFPAELAKQASAGDSVCFGVRTLQFGREGLREREGALGPTGPWGSIWPPLCSGLPHPPITSHKSIKQKLRL